MGLMNRVLSMEEKRSSLIQRAKVLQEKTQAPPSIPTDDAPAGLKDLTQTVREKKKSSIHF
jgi:hypothetical protein